MSKNCKKKIFIEIAVILTILVNMAAVLLPLNGKSTASISDQFKVFFVPANYVFSIWSIIYLGLIAFTIYQATLKDSSYKVVAKIFPLVILSSLFNTIWLFMWHYEIFAWTLPLMVMLLICLIGIYLVFKQTKKADKPRFFELFIRLPFSLYLGWISVATVANVTDILYLLQVSLLGLPGNVWAAIMIVVAGVLGVLMVMREKDYAYAAVIVWAVTGIAVKFPDEAIMSVASLGVIILLAAVSLLTQFGPKTK